jgi:hypothetical protein
VLELAAGAKTKKQYTADNLLRNQKSGLKPMPAANPKNYHEAPARQVTLPVLLHLVSQVFRQLAALSSGQLNVVCSSWDAWQLQNAAAARVSKRIILITCCSCCCCFWNVQLPLLLHCDGQLFCLAQLLACCCKGGLSNP